MTKALTFIREVIADYPLISIGVAVGAGALVAFWITSTF